MMCVDVCVNKILDLAPLKEVGKLAEILKFGKYDGWNLFSDAKDSHICTEIVSDYRRLYCGKGIDFQTEDASKTFSCFIILELYGIPTAEYVKFIDDNPDVAAIHRNHDFSDFNLNEVRFIVGKYLSWRRRYSVRYIYSGKILSYFPIRYLQPDILKIPDTAINSYIFSSYVKEKYRSGIFKEFYIMSEVAGRILDDYNKNPIGFVNAVKTECTNIHLPKPERKDKAHPKQNSSPVLPMSPKPRIVQNNKQKRCFDDDTQPTKVKSITKSSSIQKNIKKRSLFILDGTNIMYWNGDKIPTLFYIQKIVDYLQEHDLDYKVFFDIQSPHILKSEDDKNLYEEMIKDKRHYSQAPFRADILVLEKASTKENSAVISNDGYSKYKKEYPIIKDASRFYRGTVDCSDENKFILLQNRDEETIRIDI